MPKLHSVAAHTSEFVDWFGSLVALAEQSFEHYQGINLKHREVHSPNQRIGVQIGEDLIHGWLQSSPFVHNALKEVEVARGEEGTNIKKRRFS